MLEEQLEILLGLWEGPDGWTFEGRHASLRDALFRARPVQRPRPPIIIGGEGSPRSVRIAVRYADEFNLARSGPERAAHWFARLDAACAAVGRDPSTIIHSVLVRTLVGADQPEVDRRARSPCAQCCPPSRSPTSSRRPTRRAGSWAPLEQARETVEVFARAGCQRLIFQDYLPRDLAMVDLLGREFAAKARA